MDELLLSLLQLTSSDAPLQLTFAFSGRASVASKEAGSSRREEEEEEEEVASVASFERLFTIVDVDGTELLLLLLLSVPLLFVMGEVKEFTAMEMGEDVDVELDVEYSDELKGELM